MPNVDVGNGPVFADFNILATAVIAGHGVALCPVEVFRDELKRGDLIVLSEVATNRDKGYFLTMLAHASPAAFKFADWFRQEVSADTEAGGSQPGQTSLDDEAMRERIAIVDEDRVVVRSSAPSRRSRE